MPKTITPLRDILVLDTTPQDRKSASGIFLPPSDKDLGAKNGVIVAVGPDVKNTALQPGVRVVVSKYESPPIPPEVGDTTLTHLAREEFILAILPQ